MRAVAVWSHNASAASASRRAVANVSRERLEEHLQNSANPSVVPISNSKVSSFEPERLGGRVS